MSLQDFPAELLLLIFKPFADFQNHDEPSECTDTPSEEAKSNLKSLASFSKVCIKWHNILEPILYSTFRKPASTMLEGPMPFPHHNDHARAAPGPTPFPSQSDHARVAPGPIWQNNHASVAPVSVWRSHQTIYGHVTQDDHGRLLQRHVYPPDGRYTFFPDRNNRTRVAQPNQTLRLLLRTIIERPHLAENIKKLVPGSWVENVTSCHVPGLSKVLTSRPEPGIRQTYGEAFERLTFRVEYVLDGYEGSELILLLQLIPNLTTLHMAQIPKLEEWMCNMEHRLARNVSTVRLGSVDKTHEIQLPHLGVLMTLPSLRTLTIANCIISGHCQLQHTKLTHLSIQRCRISLATFGLLVEHISNLESFEWIQLPYQAFHLSQAWFGHLNALTRRMLAFVDRQRHTLRSLRILGDGGGHTNMQGLSFKKFDLLEKLTIQGRLLHAEEVCLSDQLPQSLRYLRIIKCCSHNMKRLLAAVSGRALPNLEQIEYSRSPLASSPFPSYMEYEMVVVELGKICATEGIAFVETVKGQ
jgi:hypothetical protein